MTVDEYVLDGDEYEVLETGEAEPITSEEVREKLESPIPGVIEQDDFDGNGPTLSDYFWIGEEEYPRNLSDNQALLAGSLTAFGLYSAGAYAGGQESAYLGGAILAAFPAVNYMVGLTVQDTDIEEAVENSWKNLGD